MLSSLLCRLLAAWIHRHGDDVLEFFFVERKREEKRREKGVADGGQIPPMNEPLRELEEEVCWIRESWKDWGIVLIKKKR